MDMQNTDYRVGRDDGKEIHITCDQFQRMGAYGISSVVNIPFPHYSGLGTGSFLTGSDRDWLILAMKCRPEGPDLFTERRRMVSTIGVYVLQQRREGAKFYQIVQSVDGKLASGLTPERVDLDFDQYPFQTEARIFMWSRDSKDRLLKIHFPVSWNEMFRLELDYKHQDRKKEELRLFWAGDRNEAAEAHRVAEELAGEKLEQARHPETLVLEMKPVYFTQSDPQEMLSTSNAPSGVNRYFWEIKSSLGKLIGGQNWLLPDSPYGGFTWKQVNYEDAVREGWVKGAVEEVEVET